MGDVPYPKPKPPTRSEVARARLGILSDLARVALTGGSRAVSVRRTILYGIAIVGITIGVPVVALVAVTLLALTDAVVEL